MSTVLHTGLTFTIHHGTDTVTAELLWPLYADAFRHLGAQAAFWQVFDHDGFVAQLADPRVETHIGTDAEGNAVTFGIASRNLDAFHWISPAYFSARWPREYAEGRIYYVGFSAVARSRQQQGYHEQMARHAVATARAAGAMIVLDMCGHNVDLGFARAIERAAVAVSPATMQRIDTQEFYALIFAETSGASDTSAGGNGRP